MRRLFIAIVVSVTAIALPSSSVSADLQMFERKAAAPVTFFGRGGFSADGLGQNGVGGTLQAEVPVGSTVEVALLYGAFFFTPPTVSDRTINFEGTNVTLDPLTNVDNTFLFAARADVTAQVAEKVGIGGGIFNFAINSDPSNLNGVALAVIFSNPSLPLRSIALLDGGLGSSPQVTTANFAAPVIKGSDFQAVLSLGIQHGAQDQSGTGGSSLCGTDSNMSSLVDINGIRLTSCAGNLDDGVGGVQNGNLITVGGVGDNTANPSDPFQQPADGLTPRVEDDELYDISGFINEGDTKLIVNTQNPSGDDLVFLVILSITALFNLGLEDCFDGEDNDGDGLVDGSDPDCILAPSGVNSPLVELNPLEITPRIYIDEKDPSVLPNVDRNLVVSVVIDNPGLADKSLVLCPMLHVHNPDEAKLDGLILAITADGGQRVEFERDQGFGPGVYRHARTVRFPFPLPTPLTVKAESQELVQYTKKLSEFTPSLENFTRAEIKNKIILHEAEKGSTFYADYFFDFNMEPGDVFQCPNGPNTWWKFGIDDPDDFDEGFDWYDFTFTNSFSTLNFPITIHTSETAGAVLDGIPLSAFIEVVPNCFLVECPPTPGTDGTSGLPTVVWSTDPAPGEVFVIDEIEEVGTMTLDIPSDLAEGAVMHFTVFMKEAGSGRILSTETKRFALDTTPPAITSFEFTEDGAGYLLANATVLDEAASIEFVELLVSRNGGISFAGFPMDWKEGDFLNPTLFEATFGPLEAGETIFKIRAVDEASNSSETPQHLIEVLNHPPTAAAGADQTVECTSPEGTFVKLDGTRSSDPDGDPLTFFWSDTGIIFDDPASATPTATFPLGNTTVALVVNDGSVDSSPDTLDMTVQDTIPPTLMATSTPSSLWPPEHQYRQIALSIGVGDVCDSLPTVTATAVSSEPDDAKGLGDGATTGDIKVTTAGGDVLLSSNESPEIVFDPINDLIELRAERGGGSIAGRMYAVVVTATDASGNQSSETVMVTVPHDERR